MGANRRLVRSASPLGKPCQAALNPPASTAGLAESSPLNWETPKTEQVLSLCLVCGIKSMHASYPPLILLCPVAKVSARQQIQLASHPPCSGQISLYLPHSHTAISSVSCGPPKMCLDATIVHETVSGSTTPKEEMGM